MKHNVKVKDFVRKVTQAGWVEVPKKGGHRKFVKKGAPVLEFPKQGKEVPFYAVKQAEAAGVKF